MHRYLNKQAGLIQPLVDILSAMITATAATTTTLTAIILVKPHPTFGNPQMEHAANSIRFHIKM